MIRAYAIALAAGTQAFTQGLGGALFGTGELQGDLAQGAGWVINLAVAEWSSAAPRGSAGVAARSLNRPDRAPAPWGHADDRRQHSSRILTDVGYKHDEHPQRPGGSPFK